jgi:hypothetical protein
MMGWGRCTSGEDEFNNTSHERVILVMLVDTRCQLWRLSVYANQ